MAEGRIKQVLEKEVTCPLCLEILQDPKKLPCDHVYCRACLQKLSTRNVSPAEPLSCPECRSVAPIPNGDVGNFPTAFRLNRLVEAFQQVDVNREETDTAEAAKCRVHAPQLIAMYCETCDKLLCRDCMLATKEHADHSYGFIEEMKKQLGERLAGVVYSVESQKQNLSIAVNGVDQIQCEIALYERQCQEEIEKAFRVLYGKLRQNEQKMKEEAAELYKSINLPLSQRKEALESIRKEITTEVEKAELVLLENGAESLIHQSAMQQRLKLLHEKLSKTTLSVLSKPPCLMPKVMAGDELEQHLQNQNCLRVYPIDPTKWQV